MGVEVSVLRKRLARKIYPGKWVFRVLGLSVEEHL